ncbi:MAG: helix-turn-helix domain-containing protein [Firmicutes bacterium]|nr:helix-turn-helix domain-containing protein [Bacillota bacterium]
MDTIGKRIAWLRKDENLTQVQLAQSINVTERSIQMWEADVAIPGGQSLIALANFFKTSSDFILGIKPH